MPYNASVTMLLKRGWLNVAAGGLLLVAMGCGKQNLPEAARPDPIPAAKPAPPPPAAGPVTATPSNAPALTPPIGPVPGPGSPSAPTNSAAVSAPTNAAPVVTKAPEVTKAQDLIDAAVKQAEEEKWADLTQTLLKLQGQQLTPAQENRLLELMEKLKKMVEGASPK
jgi:hypothetical protein